jgi:hypothetical protein
MIQARNVTKLRGGVTIRDYRGTGLCPPNGGKIKPLIYVEHIPVIHNVAGIQDGITLGNVLKAQGLAVMSGTDSEGNIFLYTDMDDLCYHARGSNTISCGTEHMHYLVTEPWTEAQYRAAAVLAWRAHNHHGIPLQGARLGLTHPPNTTPVLRRGFTSHMVQARAAGWSDRSDPGSLFHFGHLYKLAHYFGTHRHF